MYTRDSELFHHGIKGQKWGVENGPPYPLSNGQKKKVSKQYKKLSQKAMTQLKRKDLPKMNKEANEKAQDEITSRLNSGKISSSITQEELQQEFNKLVDKYAGESLIDWYKSSDLIAEGRQMVKDYDMTSWDKLAKTNEASIELMTMLDKRNNK